MKPLYNIFKESILDTQKSNLGEAVVLPHIIKQFKTKSGGDIKESEVKFKNGVLTFPSHGSWGGLSWYPNKNEDITKLGVAKIQVCLSDLIIYGDLNVSRPLILDVAPASVYIKPDPHKTKPIFYKNVKIKAKKISCQEVQGLDNILDARSRIEIDCGDLMVGHSICLGKKIFSGKASYICISIHDRINLPESPEEWVYQAFNIPGKNLEDYRNQLILQHGLNADNYMKLLFSQDIEEHIKGAWKDKKFLPDIMKAPNLTCVQVYFPEKRRHNIIRVYWGGKYTPATINEYSYGIELSVHIPR